MTASLTTKAIPFPGLVETFHLEAHGFHGEKHWEHPGLELVIPVSRPQALRLRGQDLVVPAGGFALYNGREPHVDVHRGETDCLGVIIPESFIASLAVDAGVDARELVFEGVALEPGPRVRALTTALFAMRGNAAPSLFAVDCLVSELTLELLAAQRHSFTPRLRRAVGTGHFPASVARAKRAIWDHVDDEDFSLEILAKAAGMSKFHLVRSFRARTGMTPMRYRNHLRLELAKSALARGGTTVLGVAATLGFGDLSTFNKACQRLTGRRPGDFKGPR